MQLWFSGKTLVWCRGGVSPIVQMLLRQRSNLINISLAAP